eukprot:462785-Rhodomonas_salina.2
MCIRDSNTAEYEKLCTDIDNELRSFLKCVDDYQTAHAEVVAACRSGILDLARARKSMGNRGMGVTTLQYPARMTATQIIDIDPENESVMALRYRSNQEGGYAGAKADSPPSGDEKVIETDPIRWFGVLVPQQLRTSQTSFSRGLQVQHLIS